MKRVVMTILLSLALVALGAPQDLLCPQNCTPTGFDPQEVMWSVRRNRGLAETNAPAPGRVGRLHNHRGWVGEGSAGKEQLTDDGEFLLDTNRTVVIAQGSENYPAVAFDGANYLVAWDEDNHGYYDIHCTRVSPSGVILDTLPIIVSDAPGHQWLSGIASDGVNYFVVWTDYRHDPVDGSIYGARVSRDGTVLDPDGIPIWTNSWGDGPAVAFAEGLFFVVWMTNGDIYGARVTPGGNVLDPLGIPISTATRSQYCPAVAFNGTDFLVAWQDERSGSWQTDIYAARVSPAGVVRDPNGIPIAVGSLYEESPTVVADGNNWFVVWQDYRSDIDWDIYGARVSPTGTVLDPQGVAISTAADDQESPRVSFDGSNYLVVWTGALGNYTDLYGARVTPSGTVLDTQAIVISAGSYDEDWPALAFDGNNFLVVWEDYRRNEEDGDIYGARVSPAGTVLDPQGVVLSYGTYEHWWPASAYDGSNFLVVWTDTRNDSDDIYGARVSPAGTVLDPQGIPISTAPHWQDCPAVAFDGTNYLVTWTDFRSNTGYADIYGARVSPTGTVLDPQGIPISTAARGQYGSAVAFDGTNYLVVWGDGRWGADDIYGARVSPNGEVLDPGGIPIMTAVNYQHDPAVAFDGTNYLVVWQHYRAGTYYDIYGARVTPGGTVLDPDGIPIRTAAGSEEVPALAFDGTNFLVVWENHPGNAPTDIYAARVSRNGTVLDTQGIVVCTTAYHKYSPTAAFTGTEFLVVWEHNRYEGDETDIYGARVSSAGTILDSGPVVRQRGCQWFPALTHGPGGQLFLVYQGWVGTVGGRTYNTQRIWGKLNPVPGIAELPRTETRTPATVPTIVRNTLNLPSAICGLQSDIALLDATGRKVLDLLPGPNDLSGLAPGVYFVSESGTPTSAPHPVFSFRKIMIVQ